VIQTNPIDARLLGVRVIASVSGGKDSAAMCLHLKEQGIPYEAVFMDTGWEHADTYAYLRGPLTEAIGPIRWLRAEVELPPDREAMAKELEGMLGHYSAMVRLCLKKGIFPSRLTRFCTEATKLKPMNVWAEAIGEDTVNVVGIRAEESTARAAMLEWEWSDLFDRWTWRPLLRWSLQDVIDIHARHQLAPNPLYLRGASRVGCWPCIFAKKSEIRFISETDPRRVAVLEALERHVATCQRANIEGRGETFDGRIPSWFQPDRANDLGWYWPIAKVVEWSRTARGGKQIELFTAADRDTGCMRWGLCDTGTKERR
jgi:3'-phosphoadenosine 5'-phosphosulfate sulfotransferase (PAPS reductase)/FAD synthetase